MTGEIKVISELVDGKALFDSQGFTVLKVTRVINDGGERVAKSMKIKLAIKSTGVAEYQEELSGKAPKPPRTFETVKKNSPEGRAMGLKHNEMTYIFDSTDEDYVDSLEKHTQEFVWRIAVFALDIKWTKADGTQAETYEEKKAILKSNGITGHHADKIYKDVNALTQFSEDRQDFL